MAACRWQKSRWPWRKLWKGSGWTDRVLDAERQFGMSKQPDGGAIPDGKKILEGSAVVVFLLLDDYPEIIPIGFHSCQATLYPADLADKPVLAQNALHQYP